MSKKSIKITKNSENQSNRSHSVLNNKCTTIDRNELRNFLNNQTEQKINLEGFFGKLNKYLPADLDTLKEAHQNQRQYGKPLGKNNASIKELVNN